MNSKKIILTSACLLALTTLSSCKLFKEDKVEGEISLSVIWNGLSALQPENPDNRVAKIVKEKTGVTLNVKFVDGDENTNLVSMFSVGKNMPDMIMAPYHGGGDPCSKQIRSAAKANLIQPVDDYLNSVAPNLVDAFSVGVSTNFVRNEINHKDFKGKKYIIPMHTPANENEYQNWGYTVYGRKDILNSLGVDPSSIHTSQGIYELAKQIKAGNFKDVNGNNIITATTWANGWSFETYLNSFKRRNFTNVVDKGDHYEWISQQPEAQEEVKFMQKFVSEGLFDKEAFSQTQQRALSKHINGGVGLTSAHYPYIKGQLKNTLYASHPEMEYVPIGPIYDYYGRANMPDTTRENGGYNGFAVMMISSNCSNVELCMKYLNFINSEEGRRLAYLGEEGVDYTNNNGQLRMTDSFFNNEKQNPNYRYNQGIDSVYTFGVSRVPFNTFDDAREESVDQTYRAVKEMYPCQMATGVLASSFDDDFDDIKKFQNYLGAVDYSKYLTAAYCADTQEEALNTLQKYNNAISAEGVLNDYLGWLYETIGGRTDILF